MKKKVLSALLVAAMTATLFAGCGGKDDVEPSNPAKPDASQGAETPATEENIDYGEGTITLWVAENAVDFTKEQVDAFLKENAPGYTATVEAVGEPDAASNMITDVEGGADIFHSHRTSWHVWLQQELYSRLLSLMHHGLQRTMMRVLLQL